MAESAVLEALTAELLGDVGKLHDDVKQLAIALPDAADKIRRADQNSTGTIQVAVDKVVGEMLKCVRYAGSIKLFCPEHGVFCCISVSSLQSHLESGV